MLAGFREENVANGQPASVEMTDAEIANPETIMPERLKLDHSGARAKLEALRKSGTLTTTGRCEGPAVGNGCRACPRRKIIDQEEIHVRHGYEYRSPHRA